MNATEAITRIKNLLGLEFRAESFATTKLVDGITEVTNNKDDDFAIGDTLYVVGESTLQPAPEGSHETREGLVVTLDSESIIIKIEAKAEMEDVSEAVEDILDEKEDMMSSAVLADGTKIETDEDGDFAVGQQLYFITSEGERVKALPGEHTTTSGITIVTDGDGIITGVKYPDESGEGSLEDMKRDMEKMKESMSALVSLITELNGKFKTDLSTLRKDFEGFKSQPDREPVLKKFNSTKDNLDYKLELIKSLNQK